MKDEKLRSTQVLDELFTESKDSTLSSEDENDSTLSAESSSTESPQIQNFSQEELFEETISTKTYIAGETNDIVTIQDMNCKLFNFLIL
jgi:hypothetical protein